MMGVDLQKDVLTVRRIMSIATEASCQWWTSPELAASTSALIARPLGERAGDDDAAPRAGNHNFTTPCNSYNTHCSSP
jgi:hypothetical protein